MSLALYDRVKFYSSTLGGGTLSETGAAIPGYRPLSTIGTGNMTTFLTEGDDGNWEVAVGTATTGTPWTLSRLNCLSSSNGGSFVNWTTAQKTVSVVLPAAYMNFNAAKHNLTATTEPQTNSDIGQGYGPGSLWLTTISSVASLFICKSAALGAAVWHQVELNTGYQSGGVSNHASAAGTNANAYGGAQAAGTDALAIGRTSSASASGATALGNSTASQGYAFAVNISSASGNTSVALSSSTASANYAFAAAGGTASAVGAVAFGQSTTAAGANSVAFMGGFTLSTGTNSLALGGGLCSKPFTFSRGVFQNNCDWTTSTEVGGARMDGGSKQVMPCRYDVGPLQAMTTNATPTVLALGDNSGTYGFVKLSATYNTVVITFIGTVLASDLSGNTAAWEIKGVLKKVGTTTTLVSGGTPTAIGTAEGALSTAVVALTADDTNDCLSITVTGIAATTIFWSASYSGVRIDRTNA